MGRGTEISGDSTVLQAHLPLLLAVFVVVSLDTGSGAELYNMTRNSKKGELRIMHVCHVWRVIQCWRPCMT